MKNLFTTVLILLSISFVSAQTITGKWKTIDDETGQEKSIVTIYEQDGKIYGKIIEILNPEKKNSKCTKCEGQKKDQPILGMVIIEGLVKDDDVYNGGEILNPSNGKVYDCRLKLDADNPDSLQVRGYIAFFYKTQYWQRVKD
jgi:uncharacterized protein (DUF2147 family)